MTKRPPSPKAIPTGKWRDLRSSILDELGDPTLLDITLADNLVLNLIAADRALEEARKNPMVTGSKGQPREHPGFAIAARAEQQARAKAVELMLTPRRKKSGSARKSADDSFSTLDELAARRARR